MSNAKTAIAATITGYLSAGLNLIFSILLARQTTPAEFGEISALIYIPTLLGPLCGLGVSQYILRKSQHKLTKNSDEIENSAFVYASITTIAVFLTYAGYSFAFLPFNTLIIALVLSPILLTPLASDLLLTLNQMRGQALQIAAWPLVLPTLKIAAIIAIPAIYEEPPQPTSAAIALTIATTAFLLSVLPTISSLRIAKPKHSTFADVKKIANEASPYGLAPFLFALYFQSSTFIIANILSSEQAGKFQAAFTIFTATTLLPGIIFQRVMSAEIHRLELNNRTALKALYHKITIALFLISVLLATVLFTIADNLVFLIFGPGYAESAKILSDLSFCLPLYYLASASGSMLVGEISIRSKIKNMLVTAMLAIPLNITLTQKLGTSGAVLALAATYIALSILYTKSVKTHVFSYTFRAK